MRASVIKRAKQTEQPGAPFRIAGRPGSFAVHERFQKKPAVSAAADRYEAEAEAVAGEVMGLKAARPQTTGLDSDSGSEDCSESIAAGDQVAAAVRQALDSPGQPLDSATRAFMELRFGHDFGRVRIHAGERASQSTRALRARAFTLGHDVVFDQDHYVPDTCEGRRLLAHELTHVLQQSGAKDGSAGAGVLRSPQKSCNITPIPGPDFVQRSGVLEVTTTEGFLPPGPVRPPVALGLAEPDCSVRAADVFRVSTIAVSPRPECSYAMIEDRRTPQLLPKFYRADYPLAGKAECLFRSVVGFDHWLGNQWNIVDMDASRVTVVNPCGDEEDLAFTGACECPPPSKAPAERRVPVTDSVYGKGTVEVFDRCQLVWFRPADCCRPVMRFEYVPEVDLWSLIQDDPKAPREAYPPRDLSRRLKVNVQRGYCGDRFVEEPKSEGGEEVGGGGSWEGVF